jgi:spore coat protein U-like protein
MGVAQPLTVRGQLLASANPGLIEAGAFSDTVTATIIY